MVLLYECKYVNILIIDYIDLVHLHIEVFLNNSKLIIIVVKEFIKVIKNQNKIIENKWQLMNPLSFIIKLHKNILCLTKSYQGYF